MKLSGSKVVKTVSVAEFKQLNNIKTLDLRFKPYRDEATGDVLFIRSICADRDTDKQQWFQGTVGTKPTYDRLCVSLIKGTVTERDEKDPATAIVGAEYSFWRFHDNNFIRID